MNLKEKRCVPCEGGTEPLSKRETRRLLGQVDGWTEKAHKIRKRMTFADFRAAMAFLGRVADVAEAEGHHPDFCVHYNRVDFTLWTHAIHGLSENDFILASKIDALEASGIDAPSPGREGAAPRADAPR
jgi:4a-hydroxytetrahydrobiopterin dehydratase